MGRATEHNHCDVAPSHTRIDAASSRRQVVPPGVMQPGVTTTEDTDAEVASMVAVAAACVLQLPPDSMTVGAEV